MNKILFFTIMLLGNVAVFAYDFEVDGICYTVTSFEDFNVAVDGFLSSLSGIVEIPDTVTYNNKSFKVTSIASAKGGSIESVKIPKTVTTISNFSDSSIEYLYIPDNVTSIGKKSFQNCRRLKTIYISQNVNSISESCFYNCENLEKVEWHPIESSIIYSYAFINCKSLKSFTVPSTCSNVGMGNLVFDGCYSLDTLIIEDGKGQVKFGYYRWHGSDSSLDRGEFMGCPIRYLYVGRSYEAVKYPRFYVDDLIIGDGVSSLVECPAPRKSLVVGKSFGDVIGLSNDKDLEFIKIRQGTPPRASGFSNYIYINTVLYVPKGSKAIYESTDIWKLFWNILEFEDPEIEVISKKCVKPTINYLHGKITFNSETEGVAFKSSITDSDITSYDSKEVQLGVTYHISVYATKQGYENSEVATATLCWIDAEPYAEGTKEAEDDMAEVRATPVLIQSNDGTLKISGAPKGSQISVFDTSGCQIGFTIANGDITSLDISVKDNIAIVKIGDKTVKVLIK